MHIQQDMLVLRFACNTCRFRSFFPSLIFFLFFLFFIRILFTAVLSCLFIVVVVAGLTALYKRSRYVYCHTICNGSGGLLQ